MYSPESHQDFRVGERKILKASLKGNMDRRMVTRYCVDLGEWHDEENPPTKGQSEDIAWKECRILKIPVLRLQLACLSRAALQKTGSGTMVTGEPARERIIQRKDNNLS